MSRGPRPRQQVCLKANPAPAPACLSMPLRSRVNTEKMRNGFAKERTLPLSPAQVLLPGRSHPGAWREPRVPWAMGSSEGLQGTVGL